MSVRADPEEERPPTMDEEEEDGEKMQANPVYLPIERSYQSQVSKYINVPTERYLYICVYVVAIVFEVSCIMFAYTMHRGG